MVLPYDNTDYGVDEVGARSIPELTDVELTNLANGEVLQYNSTTSKWENQPIILGGVDSVSTLTDTNITTPITNGSFLVYNTSNSKWENSVLLDIDTLNNLSDTNISSVADQDFLLYDSTSSKWINTPSIIDNLKNVDIQLVGNNEILKYNSTTNKWENNNLNLNEINDVNITSLQNGEVLKYNSSSGKWENQDNTDTLNELSDVSILLLSNNFVLKYDSISNLWVANYLNLTELGDTNISTLNNGAILRYNSVSQKWETNTFNLSDLDDVNFNSLTNGDLIKYNGSNFINFSPTYLDGAGISNNNLIKVVNSQTTATSIYETTVLDTKTSLRIYIPSSVISILAGTIETELFDTIKRRMHLTTNGISTTNGITITSDGRVGIGVVDPQEDLELDGNIQLDTGGAQRGRVIFYDKQNDHEHAEVDGLGEGTNGGVLAFYTKVDGGSVTEKLRINNNGGIGIGGANYGNSGQVLISNGSGSSVSWADQTDTTYSAGTGVSLVGTTFSIGQSVAASDSPSFTQLSIGNTGVNQGILNLQDITNIGTENVAQIKGLKENTNGGKLQIFTKKDGGSLIERLSVSQGGLVSIQTDEIGLLIASQDGVTEQGYIYNSLVGSKDFVIDAAIGSSTKGIRFKTLGGDRMKITDTGNVGIGTTNPTKKLVVDGETDINSALYVGSSINLKNGISSNNCNRIFSYNGTGLAGSNTQHLIRAINFNNSQPNWNSASVVVYYNVINLAFGIPFGSGKAFKSLYWSGTNNQNFQFGSDFQKTDVFGNTTDIQFRMNMISLGQWQLVCLNNNTNSFQISVEVHLLLNNANIL